MDSRDKAIEELKKQLARARAQLGPEGVERLQKMMRGVKEDSIPYDREAALSALKLFLKNHKDREGLEKKLLELLRRSE